MEKLLSFDGRIRRMGWWISSIAVGIVSAIFRSMREGESTPTALVLVLAIIGIVLWLIGLSINVRRWHDLNKSGWWVLVNLIPVLGWLYSLVMLGFMPGDQGANNYGPAPREGAIL